MFITETYRQRRKRLSEQVGAGMILLLGNEERSMNYPANVYPFRQDSTFLYFFGLDTPGLAGLIDTESGEATLLGDDATVEDVVWMGPQVPLAERAAQIGVARTAQAAVLGREIAAARNAGRVIHFLPPYRSENSLKLQSLLGVPPASAATAASVPLIQAIVAQREIKTDAELEQIEYAVDTARAMHLAAMKMARPGMVEREIAGAIEAVAVGRGGRPSFPIILTVHGETLHNPHHDNVLEDGLMVLNDCGAESPLNYASDITRTFPVSGRFTSEQRAVYEIVLSAQESAIGAMKPGVPFREIHLLACRCLAEGLKDLGLMKGSPDDAVHEGAHGLFFQCGLGHMMGLDVHDMEDLGEDFVGYGGGFERSTQFGLDHLRMARELRPGHVVTVEPGVYVIPELIDMWRAEGRHLDFIDYDTVEKWRAFGGVRIEDDLLVTEDGCRTLGTPIPRTVDEVEEACAAAAG